MPYRDFVCPDGKKVRTRVSDAATLQWWRRWKQAPGLTMDRPPDIDTDTYRAWVEDRVSVAKAGINPNDYAPAGAKQQHPVAVYAMSYGDRQVKILVTLSETDAGWSYGFRIKGEHEAEGRVWMDMEAETPDDERAAAMLEEALVGLTQLVEKTDGLFDDTETPHWMITLPSDWELMNSLHDEASADREAELAYQASLQEPVGNA